MGYVRVFDGFPGGSQCKKCKNINTRRMLRQCVIFDDNKDSALMTAIDCCEVCKAKHVTQWRQPIEQWCGNVTIP